MLYKEWGSPGARRTLRQHVTTRLTLTTHTHLAGCARRRNPRQLTELILAERATAGPYTDHHSRYAVAHFPRVQILTLGNGIARGVPKQRGNNLDTAPALTRSFLVYG